MVRFNLYREPNTTMRIKKDEALFQWPYLFVLEAFSVRTCKNSIWRILIIIYYLIDISMHFLFWKHCRIYFISAKLSWNSRIFYLNPNKNSFETIEWTEGLLQKLQYKILDPNLIINFWNSLVLTFKGREGLTRIWTTCRFCGVIYKSNGLYSEALHYNSMQTIF